MIRLKPFIDDAGFETIFRDRTELADQVVGRLNSYLESTRASTSPQGHFPPPLHDEQIWTSLLAFGYRQQPEALFKALTGVDYSGTQECQSWLEALPMSPRLGEGNSNIDLACGALDGRGKSGIQYHPTGPVCLVEAKWNSDISGYTSHDPHRNQLARVIENAATLQHHAPLTEKQDAKGTKPTGELPDDVYVTLLTPSVFKQKAPFSRLYAFKYWEYKLQRYQLFADIVHQATGPRKDKGWEYPKDILHRLEKVHLRWVTFEDLFWLMPDEGFREAMAEFVQKQFAPDNPDQCLLDPKLFPGES